MLIFWGIFGGIFVFRMAIMVRAYGGKGKRGKGGKRERGKGRKGNFLGEFFIAFYIQPCATI